ncbi:hypothetical protein LDENG_00209170 [Lucifuga dentata]|nr:hypothetical protein LDENG_00209170 [Lucifuga dentata]
MIVSNITCMKTEYIRLKHAKWPVLSFKYYNILSNTHIEVVFRSSVKGTVLGTIVSMIVLHSFNGFSGYLTSV